LADRRRVRERAAGFRSATAFVRTQAPVFWERYKRERRRPVASPPHVPNPREWPDVGLHAAWLGHSTALVKVDGFTFITDPVLGDWCGFNFGRVTLGIKRLTGPALDDLRQLPHIDLILLSHAHLDHFDKPTLRLLESNGTYIVTARNTRDLLRARRRYKSIRELGWGEQTRVGPLSIRGFEVNHWGARMRTDSYRGYNGYLIEADGRRIVFGGDTALTDSFRGLRTSRPVDLAIMPIGAYNPWIGVHCNPEQAWRMARDCRSEFILPVHHKTFRLSSEPYHEPIERLLECAGRESDRVVTTDIGQEWSLANA
jgi:L-ascorbate metabolism protein UlaG (beta-lactamase superfamily)